MGATTRRRKGRGKNKSKNGRTGYPLPVLFDMTEFEAADACDCPACSGAGLDLDRVLEEFAADLVEFDDPLELEMAGALFVSLGAALGDAYGQVLVAGFIPELEARGTTAAWAMLQSIAAVDPGEGGTAAAAAAGRLAKAGVPRPGWAGELAEPVKVTDCVRLHDSEGTASVVACVCSRAGRSHAFLVSVDELDCGAATDIGLLDADQLPHVLDALQADGRDGGFDVVKTVLDPAQLRWHVEQALHARSVHDSDETRDGLPADDDQDQERRAHAALAVLLQARMATLPAPDQPPASHDGDDHGMAALEMLAELFGGATSAGGPPRRGRDRLPAKRTKADGPAPVYQVKVGLRSSKPPIWRRLEVPADISLARLHDVIQLAFDWDDSHLHVFVTPYGDFGPPNPELGHRAEASVTLEQVAPGPRSKISYTYDFGDDWEHEIVVEKVLESTQAATAPRCTGGRRAAPPEDCGGVWGYAELVEILNDPTHPEHAARLDWLGVDNAADFDHACFDPETVTRRLARLR